MYVDTNYCFVRRSFHWYKNKLGLLAKPLFWWPLGNGGMFVTKVGSIQRCNCIDYTLRELASLVRVFQARHELRRAICILFPQHIPRDDQRNGCLGNPRSRAGPGGYARDRVAVTPRGSNPAAQEVQDALEEATHDRDAAVKKVKTLEAEKWIRDPAMLADMFSFLGSVCYLCGMGLPSGVVVFLIGVFSVLLLWYWFAQRCWWAGCYFLWHWFCPERPC